MSLYDMCSVHQHRHTDPCDNGADNDTDNDSDKDSDTDT